MVSLDNHDYSTTTLRHILGLYRSWIAFFNSLFVPFRQEKAEKEEKVESSAAESQRRLLSPVQLELVSR